MSATRESEQEAGLFAELSMNLADGIEAHLSNWTVRNIRRVAHTAGCELDATFEAAAVEAGERCRDDIGPRVRELLSTDIDEQRTTPLVLVRSAVTYATAVLQAMGIPAVDRDQFEQRSFPDDIYGLSPATMADVHQTLGETAIMWGAAKAHIHKQRHNPSS